jgi:hypothetical protein
LKSSSCSGDPTGVTTTCSVTFSAVTFA